MIVCISPTSQHYDETFNTLQYADRAKAIKTKVSRNVVSVDRHVSQYVQVIYELRQQVANLTSNNASLEQKWRQNIRQQREKSTNEIQEVIKSVRKSFADVKAKIASLGALKAEQALLNKLNTALATWKSITFPPGQLADPTYVYNTENLASAYAARLHVINSEISQHENARSMFEAVCGSCTRKVSNPQGLIATEFPELLQLVNTELHNIKLETELETTRAKDRETEDYGRKITSLMDELSSVQDTISTDISICSGDQEDKRASLQELLARASTALQEVSSALLSSGVVSAAPTKSTHLSVSTTGPALSKKRSATMRSPNPDSVPSSSLAASRPGKIQRSSLAPSAPTLSRQRSSLTAPTQASQAKSSMKPASLVRKSSNVSLSTSRASTSMLKPREEKKAVVWKDDKGEQLTEEHSKSVIDYSDTSGDASNTSLAPSSTISTTQTAVRRPLRGIPPIRKTTLKTEIIAEEDESSASFSSSAEGFSADQVNESVSSAAGDDESFQSDTTTMPLQGGPLEESGLAVAARLSAATHPVGTPPKKAPALRRISNVGPIRSAKKKNRVSFIDVGNTSAASSNADNASESRDAMPEPRRAGRTTISFQNRIAAQAAEASRRESIARAGARPLSGAALAAARARRDSRASVAGRSALGSGRAFDMSLDLNTSNRPAIWR